MSVTDTSQPLGVVARPLLRGRLHQAAFLASIAGLVWLVTSASTTRAEVAAWVYGVSAIIAYLASSSYHFVARPGRAKRMLRRADHCAIFLLIAGSFTPVCMLAVHGTWRWALLGTMWAGAVLGIVLKFTVMYTHRRLASGLYLVLGWLAVLVFPSLVHRPEVLVLIIIGGFFYTLGAVLFFLQLPRLRSRWFGYHELWHTFGVAAGALVFAANLMLVRGG